MFSGYARLLLRLLLVFFVLWLVARMKIVVLVLSWAVIFGCLWILWVKRYSKNKKLNKKLNDYFLRFIKSGFYKWMVAAGKKLAADSQEKEKSQQGDGKKKEKKGGK